MSARKRFVRAMGRCNGFVSRTLPLLVPAIAALVVVLLVGTTTARAQSNRPSELHIAVVSDGPSDVFLRMSTRIQTETRALLGTETELHFADPVDTDWTEDGVHAALNRALGDTEVDLVIGLGLLVAADVARRENLPKPVILPFVVEPRLQLLPQEGLGSGRHNLNYLTGLLNIRRDLLKFRELVPFTRVLVLVDEQATSALPGLVGYLENVSLELDLPIEMASVPPTATAALGAIPETQQAVYLAGLASMPDSEVNALLEGLVQRRLPSFAAAGADWVERGAFASLRPTDDWDRRARRVALNIRHAYLGRELGDRSTALEPRAQLTVNVGTARTLGIVPPVEVLLAAELVNVPLGRVGPEISLESAVQRALDQNLDLQAANEALRANGEDVARAEGALLPQVTLGANAQWVDPDGTSSFGIAERSARWSLDARQVIYSEDAWTNLAAQEHVQSSREEDLQARRLNVMQASAEAYLNLLRTTTGVNIQRENLRRTGSHLALAETRHAVGVSNQSEVFRWQIEIANSRSATIDSVSLLNQARVQVNRILHRPLESVFRPVETVPEERALVLLDPRVEEQLQSPQGARVLRAFMVQEATENAPELRAVRASLRAQSRTLEGQRRGFFVPTLALTAGLDHLFYRGGAGSEPAASPIPGITGPDTFSWSIGITASIPLFEGATRLAEVRQTSLRLEQLDQEQRAAVEQIAESVHLRAHRAMASRAGIQLARDASDAAESNLELVSDAYSAGQSSIITVIDAQNQALISELNQLNAEYDYLIDLVRLERAVGFFSIGADDDARNAFLRRFTEFRARSRTTDFDSLEESP